MKALFTVLATLAYVALGLRVFGSGLFSSPRYVRQPPAGGLWGPRQFLSRDTWTPEGLKRRNRLLAWQGGLVILMLILALLF